MKRIIMILSLVMILGFSACDASGSAVNSDKREDRKEEKAEGGQAGTVAQGNEYRPFWASLLDTSSEVYNNDLAMMAAELSEEAEDAYADKIKKCYKEKYLIPCVEDFYYREDNYESALKNEVNYQLSGGACAIGHDVWRQHGEETVVLVITARGSKTLGEYAGDVFKGYFLDPDKVHTFLNRTVWDNVYDFEEKIRAGLDEYLELHREILDAKQLKVLIVGHSLGGAAANMLGARMTAGVGGNEWWSDKLTKSDIYVYTFGTIKVLATEDNMSYGYENIHNIYNYYDSFGPNGNLSVFNASSPYAKFGHTEVYCDDSLHDDEPEITSCNNHEMSNYRRALEEERRQGNDGSHLLHLSCQGDDFEPVSGNSTAEISSVEDFSIEGSWKSVGDEGFGQAQPGAIIKFEEDQCNFFSPLDKYNLYRQNGKVYLECTSYIFSQTLKFEVRIIDNDNIEIKSDSILTKLMRLTYSGDQPGAYAFALEGTWKSVGTYGFGQAQPGATVTFDGEHCNFYSPYDTYNFYEEDGVLKLSCKNVLWQDVVTFVVEIVDDNYVKVIYTKDAVTELKRVS